MLKTVPTACLVLALCPLSSLTLPSQAGAQPQAQTGDQIASPLLSQAALSALSPEGKYLYLQGVTAHWKTVADGRDFAFVHAAVDAVVSPAGAWSIPVGQALPFGPAVLLTYRVTGNPIYAQAAKQLRTTLQPQQEKGDMATAPFLADFGVTFGDASAAEQAADILLRIDTTGRDLETGLLHGSSPAVDLSRNTFYALDLIETIDRLPIGFHHRRGLAEALNKTVSALIAPHNNHPVWQSPGQPVQTLLLNAYVVARAVRLGELAGSDAAYAQQMIEAIHSAGLAPSDEGARLLEESEADQLPTEAYGQGKTIVADGWFSAPRTNPDGKGEASPSKWDDDADKGLRFLGHACRRYGMQLDTLRVAPTAGSLSSAQVYVLASPVDAASHEVTKQDADAVEAWVKDGGVLVLLRNKSLGGDLSDFNTLADRFGMHFSQSDRAKQQDTLEGRDLVQVPAGDGVFQASQRLFLPESATLTLSPLAHPVLRNQGGILVATTSVGRGTVLAIASPWLTNEHLDGRRSLPTSDNFNGAIDLAGWILKQTQQ